MTRRPKVHLCQTRPYERAECGKPTLGLATTHRLEAVTCAACLARYRVWQRAWRVGQGGDGGGELAPRMAQEGSQEAAQGTIAPRGMPT
jgi:hypothetical protein